MLILYFLIFIFGLIMGSFLNCVIFRLENKKGFIKGKSFCPHCLHSLSWKDLIPLLSFFLLKRKCRYCQKEISWQYPLVELSTASMFVWIFYFWQNQELLLSNLIFLLIIFSFLILIFIYDLKHMIIPDTLIIIPLLITFIYFLGKNINLLNHFLAGLFSLLFFLLIVIISLGKGMGLGDVKLVFFLGFLLGYPNIIVALFLSFLIGAIIGIGLILNKKKQMKSEVPFGPFLVIGTLIAYFWGTYLFNLYVGLL
ncbi:MAG: prepilin peptidase [Candidatus Pacebacteria bacterium]|nr:prepilin peptidase [Candidatus Paceibacterota bacterium]